MEVLSCISSICKSNVKICTAISHIILGNNLLIYVGKIIRKSNKDTYHYHFIIYKYIL